VEKIKRFSLPLPPDEHQRFKVHCARHSLAMAKFLADILKRELDRHERASGAKPAKTVRTEVRA
jgi:hypothetical protein